MKKLFITLVLMVSFGAAMAQQIDSTSINETIRKIGTASTKSTPQPTTQSTAQNAPATEKPAQYERAQWFTIGAKIGYNITLEHDKVKDLYSLHTGMRHGGSTGIYMRLGTNVFCQPEVLYTFAIYDEKRNFSGDTLSRDMQTHTIDVPVLLGYSPICSETFKFRILLGPRFAFNVNKSDKYNNVPTTQEGIAVSMNKGRLGLDCGIGFDFWRISLDLRYILMEDIFKCQYLDSESGAWKKAQFWVSTFNVSLGYNIWGNNMPSKKKQKYDPTAYDFFKKKQ